MQKFKCCVIFLNQRWNGGEFGAAVVAIIDVEMTCSQKEAQYLAPSTLLLCVHSRNYERKKFHSIDLKYLAPGPDTRRYDEMSTLKLQYSPIIVTNRPPILPRLIGHFSVFVRIDFC